MQHDIDIFRRSLRRNMLQTKSQTAPDKIDDQRPFEIAVAISPNYRHRWPNRAQFIKNSFSTNVAKVPDLISAFRNIGNALRQFVMRVGENKNFHVRWIGRSAGDAENCGFAAWINIKQGTARST